MLASVIEGKVNQYVLDGKDISVKVPTVLLERMERSSHQVSQEMHNCSLFLTCHIYSLTGFCGLLLLYTGYRCSI